MLRVLILLGIVVWPMTTAKASFIGQVDFPGYSARDILLQGGSAGDGVYYIDPDLPGGDAPFQVWADMTSGGWTLADDAQNVVPDLTGQPNALNILAIAQTAQIRLVNANVNAYFTGNYYGFLPTQASWTLVSGNHSALAATVYDRPWALMPADTFDIYIRESNTLSYPAPVAAVPEPTSCALLGLAMLGAGVAIRRRRN